MSEQDKIREMLSAYLDGELDFMRAKQVQRALEEDPALAEELARLTAVRDLLRRLPQQSAPEGFVASVLEKAERSQLMTTSGPSPEPKASPLVRYWAIAAVVLVGAGIGLVIYNFLWSAPSQPQGRPAAEQLAQAPESAMGSQTRTIAEALDEHLALARPEQDSRSTDLSDDNVPVMSATAPVLPAEAPATADRVQIATDDLKNTTGQIELALGNNSIRLVSAFEADQSIQNKPSALSNVYYVATVTPSQVDYVVFVPREQTEHFHHSLAAIQGPQSAEPQTMPVVIARQKSELPSLSTAPVIDEASLAAAGPATSAPSIEAQENKVAGLAPASQAVAKALATSPAAATQESLPQVKDDKAVNLTTQPSTSTPADVDLIQSKLDSANVQVVLISVTDTGLAQQAKSRVVEETFATQPASAPSGQSQTSSAPTTSQAGE